MHATSKIFKNIFVFLIKDILQDSFTQKACLWAVAFHPVAMLQITFCKSTGHKTVAGYIRNIMPGWLFIARIVYFSHTVVWMFKGQDCIYT